MLKVSGLVFVAALALGLAASSVSFAQDAGSESAAPSRSATTASSEGKAPIKTASSELPAKPNADSDGVAKAAPDPLSEEELLKKEEALVSLEGNVMQYSATIDRVSEVFKEKFTVQGQGDVDIKEMRKRGAEAEAAYEKAAQELGGLISTGKALSIAFTDEVIANLRVEASRASLKAQNVADEDLRNTWQQIADIKNAQKVELENRVSVLNQRLTVLEKFQDKLLALSKAADALATSIRKVDNLVQMLGQVNSRLGKLSTEIEAALKDVKIAPTVKS